jgi:hypothetical protein
MYKKRQANFSMEYLAVRELKKYENGRYSTGEPCAVPIEEIIEKQYDISIEYHYLRKNLSNLGQMVFEGGHVPIYDMEKKCYTLIDVPEKTMMIDIRLLQDRRFANRLRFTYAHELAHFLIHKEHFTHSEQSPALLAGEEEEYDDVIEKQANMFCSCFLIPAGQMKKVYNRLMAKGRSQNIVKEMAVIFGVAPATMQIRLYEHGLV